jgi:hypothetical protein
MTSPAIQSQRSTVFRGMLVAAVSVAVSFGLGVGVADAAGVLTAPVKAVPKAAPAKPAPSKAPPKAPAKVPAKKKQKVESDTSAGRDKFCNALLASRTQIIANIGLGTGSTLQEIIATTADLNMRTQWDLADQAHLKILRYAALEAGSSYNSIGLEAQAVAKRDNFKAELDATFQAIVNSSDFGGFDTLQAYAISRCNFSMFVADLENLDAAPDDVDIAKLMNSLDTEAAATAKIQFPPAPPKSATWPRKDRYIGVAKSFGVEVPVQP